jgi:putative ABC transport system permease protein
MNPLDILMYSWRSLRTTKLRTYLTIIGIVIGVIAMVVITSISEGVQRDINGQLSAFGTDKMFIVPSIAGSGGSAFGGSPMSGATNGKLFQRDVDSVASVTGVKSVSSTLYGRASLEFKGKSVTSIIFASDSVFFDQWTDYLVIENGRVFKDNERRVVVLGYDAAKSTFGKDELGVGNTLKINGKDYRVIGVMKKIGSSLSAGDDSSIYIPFEDGKTEFASQLSRNEVQMIGVQLAQGYNTSDVQSQIEGKLASNHKVTLDQKDFMVVTSDYINNTIGTLLSTLSIFLFAITMISTFVGGIGIMNTMFMGVLERFQEIGILKAIGASERDILLIFITESGILGFLGGVFGLLLGVLMLIVLGTFGIPYWLRYRIIIFAFVFSAIVGIIAGFIPSRQAAKLDPVDALRYE